MQQNKEQAYNDGIVKLYKLGDASLPGDIPKEALTLKQTLRYHERTVGINRYYAALKDDVKIAAVVRCPRVEGITESKTDILIAVPKDGLQYKVVQIQYPENVVPPVMDLSLERLDEDYDIQ